MQAPATLATGDTLEYGLGLRRGRIYRGARVVESTGSDPGYQAYLGRYADHGLAIAVICNAGSTASPIALAHGVADVFLAGALAPFTAPIKQAGVAVPIERIQSARRLSATNHAGRRSSRRARFAARRRGRAVAVPLAENRFAVIGEAGDIVFAEGAHGGYQRRILVSGQCRSNGMSRFQPAAVQAPYTGEYQSAERARVNIDSPPTIPRW